MPIHSATICCACIMISLLFHIHLSVPALPSQSVPYGILQNSKLAMQPQHQILEPAIHKIRK
uniref:Uncharacterized protein n=1 Tax=Arundo donax TaxID=35708 RepID=A0A0A9DYA8_ARUDO